MREAGKAVSAAFLTETTACLKEAVELKKSKPNLPEQDYRRRCEQTENRLDHILEAYAEIPEPDAARFIARLTRRRAHLFTFLYHDAVPPTNNHAERMIRPAVIARKTQGCNKSAAGAQAHAILGSILVSEKQQGRSPVARLADLIRERASPN